MDTPKRYTEAGTKLFKAVLLSDELYAQAIDAFIVVCTDFVPVNRTKKVIYLAKRSVQPARGVWRFGGRQRTGEGIQESCVRLAKRELDLTIAPERFVYLLANEDVWAVRKHEPTDNPFHGFDHVFSIELSEEEIKHAAAHLDPKEYDAEFGIQAYDRERLLKEEVHPQLIDMYDTLFPGS